MHIDSNLYHRNFPEYFIGLDLYKYSGLKQIVAFDVSEDDGSPKSIAKFNKLLNKGLPILAFYKQGTFAYAKVAFEIKKQKRVYYNVQISDSYGSSAPILESQDIYLYDDNIEKTVKYNDLIKVMLELQKVDFELLAKDYTGPSVKCF